MPVAGAVRAIEAGRRFLPALPLSRGGMAVAAGGIAGGIFVLAARRLMRRRRGVGRRGRRREMRRSVVASRSFLVDVHLLDR